MNTVQVTGRLVRDPELRELPDGGTVCSIRLAVDGMGRGHAAGFIDVTEFGPAGEASADMLTKGWLVAASGRLDYREWTDKTSSKRHSAVGITGRIEFLASPRSPSESRSERRPAVGDPAS